MAIVLPALQQTGFIIIPALIMGIIIGILEIIFVYKDVPHRWVSNILHAFIFSIFFVFINMNVEYVFILFNWSLPFPIYFIYLFIGLVAFIKIYGAIRIKVPQTAEDKRRMSCGGRFIHTCVIALLIATSPYIWKFIELFILQQLPF